MREQASIVAAEAKRMAEVVDDFMVVARIDDGIFHLNRRWPPWCRPSGRSSQGFVPAESTSQSRAALMFRFTPIAIACASY